MQQIEEDLYYLAHSINGRDETPQTDNSVTNSHTEARVTKIEEKLETLCEKMHGCAERISKLEGALTAIQHNGNASNNYVRLV